MECLVWRRRNILAAQVFQTFQISNASSLLSSSSSRYDHNQCGHDWYWSEIFTKQQTDDYIFDTSLSFLNALTYLHPRPDVRMIVWVQCFISSNLGWNYSEQPSWPYMCPLVRFPNPLASGSSWFMVHGSWWTWLVFTCILAACAVCNILSRAMFRVEQLVVV